MIKIVLTGEPIRRVSPTFSKYRTFDSQKNLLHANKFQVLDQIKLNPAVPFPKHVPIELELCFYFPIPNGKENLFSWGLLDHIDTPDTDNLCKFYLDVLKTIAFCDDRQVHIANARKEYSFEPRTEINIMPKKPECCDQVKEVLSMMPVDTFVEIATHLNNIVELDMARENPYHMQKSIHTDFDEIAYLILDFAEKHADILKKINKKFPGLAKVLKERMENK